MIARSATRYERVNPKLPAIDTNHRLTTNFERFNNYAAEAAKCGDNADVFAILALAFEVSQLRYQLSLKGILPTSASA